MTANSESKNTILRLWLLMHRVRDMLVRCEDSILGEYGITTEQFSVLGAVKSRGGSLRPVDLAQVLERSPNSMSMLVDRMVKAGLVRRTRDRKDRRTVNVTLTSKGENALGPAMAASWDFVQKLLSRLSQEDRQVLADLLEKIKCDLVGYLNPDMDMAEIIKRSMTNQPGLYQRMVKNLLPAGSEEQQGQGTKQKKGSS